MLKKQTLMIMAGLILLLAGCAERNTAWQEGEVLTLERQIPVVGYPLDIAFDDDYIYVAQDQGGLSIIDRDDYSLRWLTSMISHDGSTVNFNLISKVAVVGEHHRLFVNETTGADEIKIVDISDQDSLNLIDAITGGTYDIQDMKFMKIEQPTGEDIIETIFCTRDQINYGRYNGDLWLGTTFYINPVVGYASGVELTANHIFVASQQRGLVTYDRATENKVSELALPGEALKVEVLGNFAFVASRQGGLNVVNIADPSHPVLVDRFDTTGYATTVDVHGTLAAVSSGGGGIYLFDISNPSHLVLKEQLTEAGYTYNAKFYGDKLIVASRDSGVLIYAID